MKKALAGKNIRVSGIVQGVGFRPFIFNLAKKNHITGWVRNSSAGVEIVANGAQPNIELFLKEIKEHFPPLAKIDTITITDIAPDGHSLFEIIESNSGDEGFMPISPDVSICEDCIRELFDPLNRRYRYPFINCTNCGPRFTIIKDIPYDRPNTTMKQFDMCDPCRVEYKDPLNRRFHAQPTACSVCGPRIWFENKQIGKIYGEQGLQQTRNWIAEGKIIAIKGLGGFHLVCNALDENAVLRLRERKKRTDKPFAVMATNLPTAEKYSQLSNSEKEMLASRQNPIIITVRNSNSNLPGSIAPFSNTLGIMLPYTPLHYLLMEPAADFPDLLIMTSGNMSEEPIAYSNESSRAELSDIADAFLFNDRDIETRVDDSVVVEIHQEPYFLRRSRGFAPNPVQLKTPSSEILAVGAELKNTFCLTKGPYAFVSHHIGDLQNLETLKAFEESIPHYENIFKINPTAIACDLHPDYLSTQYAHKRAKQAELPLFSIQHHHAHLAACLADNQWVENEPVIGIVFDGTGYGTDGHIWGGEVFFGDFNQVDRRYHLAYLPLPGGDAAIKYPKKIAAGYLWKAGIEWQDNIPSIAALSAHEQGVLFSQLEKQINCPLTSSIGRLFDAVASLIGLRQQVNYEAQAAIELENSIDPLVKDAYIFEIDGRVINPFPVLNAVLHDFLNHKSIGEISAKFHNGICRLILDLCTEMAVESGCRHVALSGGVMQNKYLMLKVIQELKDSGFTPLCHKNVPANDGGISLGQAVIANYQLQ